MKSIRVLAIFCFGAFALAGTAQAEPEKKIARPIDFFNRVEITFTASDLKPIGENSGEAELPAETVEGRLIVFIPKVKEDAQGFWESQMVRFASMSVKAGDYSWPLSGVSGSIQFIDNRPMRMVIGRRPGGRDTIRPGTQDFALTFTRESRSTNDYSLEFSSFAFGLFGKPGVEYVAGKGDAKIRILEEVENKEKNSPVDFGFTIGSFAPDQN
ncbi:MAG: hypothetical protein AAGA36_13385 [Pseudomonadota bacterium]